MLLAIQDGYSSCLSHILPYLIILHRFWQKQPSSRTAKEAEETEMATTYRDSFENEEDKKKNERKLGQANTKGMGKREWEKGNARRTAGTISSSADVREEEPF